MTTRTPTRDMKRWTVPQIHAAIRTLFEDQGDPDFTPYEERTGVLYRAGNAITSEMVVVEKHYQQFGLIEVETSFGKFPVSGVFTQGIEGYVTYRGNLYRLLNIARLSRINGALQCALFTSGGEI